jgi:hypothetical protein
MYITDNARFDRLIIKTGGELTQAPQMNPVMSRRAGTAATCD